MHSFGCMCIVLILGLGQPTPANAAISKRFLLDSYLNLIATEYALAFKGDCILCKCHDICTGEHFLPFADEAKICGDKLWNSINCTDQHHKVSATVSLTEQPTIRTTVKTTTTLKTPTKPETDHPPESTQASTTATQSSQTLHPIQETFCANVHNIKCGTDLAPICASDKHFYLNKCEYSKALCATPNLRQMDLSYCQH